MLPLVWQNNKISIFGITIKINIIKAKENIQIKNISHHD